MANTPRDKKLPMTFNLPDGDVVALITWEYVLDKMEANLGPVISQLGNINGYLNRIDQRIDVWLAAQNEDEM